MSNNSLSVHRVSNAKDFLGKVLPGIYQALNQVPVKQSHGPLQETLRCAFDLGCKTVVSQSPVRDPDFTAEHSAYYSKLFRNISRYCIRLHFFRTKLKNRKQSPLDFIDDAYKNDGDYLGFLTLRPLQVQAVGASILRPPRKTAFVLSKDKFPVNLAGRAFCVKGTPFMQQDNAVGACAQAAIWMALRTLRRGAGNSAFDPAQITQAATRFLADQRTFPNREGLNIFQIIEAIRSSGHSPYLLQLTKNHKNTDSQFFLNARRQLYSYIESEIPVILCLFPKRSEGHAVVLVGHGWTAKKPAKPVYVEIPIDQVKPLKALHAVSWVNEFYIHNDNTGPYRSFYELPTTDDPYGMNHLVYAIPVLPPGVMMTAEEAERSAYKVLGELISDLPTAARSRLNRRLVLRTYLRGKASFRKWVVDSTMSPTLKAYYRTKVLPQYVWVTEINEIDGYQNAHLDQARRVGEILIDSTEDAENAKVYLSAHLNYSGIDPAVLAASGAIGVLFDLDPFADFADKAIFINDEQPYGPLCRRD